MVPSEASVLAARTLAGAHRDGLVLAPNTLQPEIQPLISRGQIVSGVLPLLTDRQTTSIIMALYGYACTIGNYIV